MSDAEGGGPLSRSWRVVKETVLIIRSGGWAMALFLALVVIFVFFGQARDLVRAQAEGDLGWNALMTSLGTAALGLAIWQGLRVSFSRPYAHLPPFKPWHRHLWTVFPRWAGLSVPIFFAVMFFSVGQWIPGLIQLSMGGVLHALFIIRRPVVGFLFPRANGKVTVPTEPDGDTAGRDWSEVNFVLACAGLALAVPEVWFLFSPIELPRALGTLAVASISLAVVIQVLSIFTAMVEMAWTKALKTQAFSPAVLFALAATLVVGVNWGAIRHTVPVRDAAEAPALPNLEPVNGEPSYAERWLDEREAEIRASTAEEPYTVYVVAAEGGGIRAAYWTAALLARWQDHDPCFARRIFAISGVSGGALGAASFAAGLRATEAHAREADLPSRAAPATCGPGGGPIPQPPAGESAPLAIQPLVTRQLGDDHLAPVVAGVLPDVVGNAVARFMPRDAVRLDRGYYLERSWADSWAQAVGDVEGLSAATQAGLANLFSHQGDFFDLWRRLDAEGRPEPRLEVGAPDMPPALILSTTSVRTGDPWMAAPVLLPLSGNGEDERDATCRPPNLAAVLGARALSTPAAVHLSARFTYISPAGRLDFETREDGGCEVEHDLFVDGGYFEGSGGDGAYLAADALARAADPRRFEQVEMAVLANLPVGKAGATDVELPSDAQLTAGEPMEAALAPRGAPSRHVRIVPIIIQTEPEPAPRRAVDFLPDLQAPLVAFFKAREARGRQAVGRLTRLTSAFNQLGDANAALAEGAIIVCTLGPGANGEVPPLGWAMSQGMRSKVDEQVEEAISPGRLPCSTSTGAPATTAELRPVGD